MTINSIHIGLLNANDSAEKKEIKNFEHVINECLKQLPVKVSEKEI